MKTSIILLLGLVLTGCNQPSSDLQQNQGDSIPTPIEQIENNKVAERPQKQVIVEQYLDDLTDPNSWLMQLTDMQGAFELIEMRDLTNSQRVFAWKKFLSTYSKDIPDTTGDQQLRKEAIANIVSANLAHATSLFPDFHTEAVPIIEDILKQDSKNIEALILKMRFDELYNIRGQRSVISQVKNLDDQLRSDFYLSAARQYQEVDLEKTISFYEKVTDTSKLSIIDEPYYQNARDRLLTNLFRETARVVRSTFVKGDTQVALGLTSTVPTNSEQWTQMFSRSNRISVSVYQPFETRSFDGSISLVGDSQSVTIYFYPGLSGDEQQLTIRRRGEVQD